MKSGATRKKFPASPAEWDAVIAAAPGKDRLPTAKEEAAWSHAIVVKQGGYAAVREALAQKRRRGERGPQQSPAKQLEIGRAHV